MSFKVYLPLSAASFLVATTGADVIARMTIANEPLTTALREHFYWAGVQFVGTSLLLAPFAGVALVCAGVEKRAQSRSAAFIFGAAMLVLIYFYFQGHQAAQHALLEQHWTAAALSIRLLPFFVGLPVAVTALGVGILVARFDRRIGR
jgi:hypothetical protein